jgi:hypothetical protein
MGAADRLATWSFGCLKLEGEPMDRLIATIAEHFDLEVAAARRMDDGGEAAVWWLGTDRGGSLLMRIRRGEPLASSSGSIA